jgi:bifunctional non-homologous end joining protein LigD
VATPLGWDELSPELDPRKFDVASVPQRLRRLKQDPWADMQGLLQTLPALPAKSSASV